MAAEEFREDSVRGATGEKFREAGAEGMRDDEFRRRAIDVHGPEPAAEELPDGRPAGEREMLQQALRNAPELDMTMVGGELATHLLAIAVGLPLRFDAREKGPASAREQWTTWWRERREPRGSSWDGEVTLVVG